MTKIYFKFDENFKDDLTLEQWEVIEEAMSGRVVVSRLRPFMAKFMTDEKGEPLAFDKAMKTLGEQKMKDLGDIATAFAEAVRQAAVPKANGNSSESTSEPPTQPG